MEEKLKCPLQKIERRFRELGHWQKQLANSYHCPDKFQANLNVVIQSLRNVTFILQSEKNQIPNFDFWYAKWQEKMRNDAIMSWLHKTRNQIVKKSDLEISSYATVRALTHFNIPIMKLRKISPFESTEKIIKDIVKFSPFFLPRYLLNSCVLIIERHWSTADTPEPELINIVIYGYKFLKNLIIDAHKQSGLDYVKCFENEEPLIDSRKICSMCVSLASGKKLNVESKTFNLIEDDKRVAEKRYGSLIKELQVEINGRDNNKDLFKMAEPYVEYSKKILKKDKFHTTLLFLWSPNKGFFNMINLIPKEREDKYLLMESVLDIVKKTKSEGLLFITDTWHKTYKNNKSLENLFKNGKGLAEARRKNEALMVVAARSNGEIKTFLTPYSRRFWGAIKIKKTKIVDIEPYFLFSILQFWRNKTRDKTAS